MAAKITDPTAKRRCSKLPRNTSASLVRNCADKTRTRPPQVGGLVCGECSAKPKAPTGEDTGPPDAHYTNNYHIVFVCDCWKSDQLVANME